MLQQRLSGRGDKKELSGKHHCVKCMKKMGTEGISNRYINFQSALW